MKTNKKNIFVSLSKNGFSKTIFWKMNRIIEYAKNDKVYANEILNKCDMYLQNSFNFTERWDMEACSEIINMNDNINWEYSYNGDPEWMYALVRFTFVKNLAIAYSLTNNKKYYDKANYLIKDFMSKNSNSENRENSTWRTIDSGIRLSNIISFFGIIMSQGKFIESDFDYLYEVMKTHVDFLVDRYEDWKKLSNWGVIQSLPLLEFYSIFKDCEDFEYLKEISLERMEKSMVIQVYDDGSHWERSPMYHNEVINIFSKVYNLCNNLDLKLSDHFKSKLIKMHEYNLFISKPNRTQPMQGDSDETILNDRFQVASLLFDRQDFKFVSSDILEPEVVFDYGEWTLEKWKSIDKFEPKLKDKHFLIGGNVYLRNSWNKNSDWLWFSNGPIGSGHGHGDSLHLSFDFDGKSFMIDPGRYTYKEDDNNRYLLKTNYMHNTTLVDNDEFQLFKSSWKTISSPNYFPILFNNDTNGVSLIQSGHDGYFDNKGSIVFRTVVSIEGEFNLVIDELQNSTNQKRVFSQNWVLDDMVTVCDGSVISLEQKNTNVYIKQLLKTDHFVENIQISKSYNKLTNSKKIVFKSKLNKFYTLISKKIFNFVKLDVLQNNEILVSDDIAQAFKIFNSENEFIVYFAHKQITNGKKVIFVDNIPIYGRVVIIKNQHKKNQEIVVLK